MVLLMVTVWYPHGKAKEVARKYIEMNKKYPPDRSLSKTLGIGVTTEREGIKVIAFHRSYLPISRTQSIGSCD